MKSFEPVAFQRIREEPFATLKVDEDVLEALKAITAVVAEMGREPIKLPDLDMDGCLYDSSDNDRGIEEDAAFEDSFDIFAPLTV